MSSAHPIGRVARYLHPRPSARDSNHAPHLRFLRWQHACDPRPEKISPRFIIGNNPDGMTEIKPCSRCSRGFYPSHGNQTLCGTCRASRRQAGRMFGRVSFGVRSCGYCGREFEAFAAHARYCSTRCCDLARKPIDRKYARPEHRGGRRRWAPLVAMGLVRCARGAACRRAECLDGNLVGGLITHDERWHLGHPDGESVGGPEHVACNTGAPSRLRAKWR